MTEAVNMIDAHDVPNSIDQNHNQIALIAENINFTKNPIIVPTKDAADLVRIDSVDGASQESQVRQLQLEAETAVQKNQGDRFDIVRNLPYDIIPDILAHLKFNEQLLLLNISKAWRDKISAFPSAWSKIVINKTTNLSSNEISMLTLISRHITNIELDELKDPSYVDSIFAHTVNTQCTQLKMLTVTGCTYHTDKLLDVLSRVAPTLTHFSLNYSLSSDRRNPIIPYKTVLSNCRNLQAFEYCLSAAFSTVIDGEAAGYLDPGYVSTALTQLNLRFANLDIGGMEQVLSACSNNNDGKQLRHLSFNLSRESINRVMDLIQCYCKCLETLNINDRLYDEEKYSRRKININNEPNAITSSTAITTKANGELQELAVSLDHPLGFTSYFVQHSATIQSLKLNVMLDNNRYETQPAPWMHTIDNLNNLRSLVIEGCGINRPLSNTAVSILLNKSPNLCWLHLNDCKIPGNQIPTAIANLRHLQKFELWECSVDEYGFGSLFEIMAARSRHKAELSSLEQVLFMASIGLGDSISRLSDIPSLRKIELFHVSDEGVNESNLIQLSKSLKTHPCIESVDFDTVESVSDAVLEHLAAVKQLKHLKLVDLSGITIDGLKFFNGTEIELIFDD